MREAYTSTGVRAPWVTEQQTAPAKANLEYRARPLGLDGSCARATFLMASTWAEPVEVGGAEAAIVSKRARLKRRNGRKRMSEGRGVELGGNGMEWMGMDGMDG